MRILEATLGGLSWQWNSLKKPLFLFSLGCFSNHDDVGNKITTNLHLTMKNRVPLERFLFLYTSHTWDLKWHVSVVVWRKIRGMETEQLDLCCSLLIPFSPHYSLFKFCSTFIFQFRSCAHIYSIFFNRTVRKILYSESSITKYSSLVSFFKPFFIIRRPPAKRENLTRNLHISTSKPLQFHSAIVSNHLEF